MKKELQGLENNTEMNIHLNSISLTLKKVINLKTPNYDGIHEF